MPPRQAGGIPHKIMYVAHQALGRCLIHDNIVIHADSFLHLELIQDILEYTQPRSTPLQVRSKAWYQQVHDHLITSLR